MEGRLNKWEIFKFGEALRGVNIAGRKGRFWLTQTADSHDHIVRVGDNFTIRTEGKFLSYRSAETQSISYFCFQ